MAARPGMRWPRPRSLYTFDDDGRPRYKSRRDRPAIRNPLQRSVVRSRRFRLPPPPDVNRPSDGLRRGLLLGAVSSKSQKGPEDPQLDALVAHIRTADPS